MKDRFSITVFGDSIAFGQGVPIIRNWVSLMNYEYPEIFWTNNSVNGNTSRQALDRFPYEIQGKKHDAIIIAFGLNDCNYWETDHGLPRVSLMSFTANCLELANRSRHFGIENIFFLTNHPTFKGKITSKNIDYDQGYIPYLNEIRKLPSLDNRINIVDTYSAMVEASSTKGLQSFILDDGIHLNELGHKVYYESISKIIGAL